MGPPLKVAQTRLALRFSCFQCRCKGVKKWLKRSWTRACHGIQNVFVRVVKSSCLTRMYLSGQRLKLSLLGPRDQRLKRAEIDLTMGMMIAMNHDSGHVGDDVVHPQAGEGGRPDPGEHRLVERQAQGGSDCPSGLV